MNTPDTQAAPSIEDRLDAIELLLQQLLLVLESEPKVTAVRLASWCAVASAAMRAHGSATEAQLDALSRLIQRVTA